MTIAITGASGHLGRLTVESLIARGVAPETILATARHPESLARFGERGVRTRLLDYDRPETIPAALQGVDTLLLISSRGAQDRVQQHQSVIDSARSAGIGRVVYTSTIPGMVLSPDHVATEQVLKQSGLATTILRNGWYTDNYAPSIPAILASGELIASVGTGRVASATRSELAEATARVLDEDAHDGKTYTLTADKAWGYDELSAAIGKATGRSVRLRNLSSEDHLQTLRDEGVDEGAAGFLVAVDRDIKAGLLGVTSPDLTRLLERPPMSLAQAIQTLCDPRTSLGCVSQ